MQKVININVLRPLLIKCKGNLNYMRNIEIKLLQDSDNLAVKWSKNRDSKIVKIVDEKTLFKHIKLLDNLDALCKTNAFNGDVLLDADEFILLMQILDVTKE